MKNAEHLLLISAVLATVVACDGRDAFDSKSDWSSLQGIEFDYRSKPLSSPVLVHLGSYRVAGLPRSDRPGNVWVLLNPSSASSYKRLPEGSYRLSEVQLAKLGPANPAVLAELKKHVRE